MAIHYGLSNIVSRLLGIVKLLELAGPIGVPRDWPSPSVMLRPLVQFGPAQKAFAIVMLVFMEI